ncbi:WecB/TagA/CpsF family glycosyltransferase [Peribacillus sp. NJ11]|uniref:WecB/TagA/CpsF family glycosyltransferase n=1 Tax=Peribacillus sp. NJ11 TaxID=3055861 RepID=UPI0025A0CE8E|nr:WecB/TagA/CpsF family glycosyltransferase [Peribacillus sp. NJ11]MDM5221854.1 WecB/TagA/CpsF family glycosyltransferase [Peribacillus sp. NJ11]
MRTSKIYDCEIAAINMNETLKVVGDIIDKKVYTQHVVLNASKVVLMKEDPELKKIIQDCSLINADGQSIVWASKLLGYPLPERVAGIDLMERIIEMASEKSYGVFFFGAKEEVVENVVNHYKELYPNLKVSGYRNGYFTDDENPEIVETIKKSKADILLVAFSSPQKEYWLSKYGEEMQVPFVMGVGGSFDVVAGVTKRAPKWMQNLGLEWFYRFTQEPGRMWKRYLVGNTKFIIYTLEEKFKMLKG